MNVHFSIFAKKNWMKSKKDVLTFTYPKHLLSIQSGLKNISNITISLIKIALGYRRPSPILNYSNESLVILANGPSAKDFLTQKSHFLSGKKLATVNHAVRSEYFTQLKPSFHFLADPAFFIEEKIADVFDIMAQNVDWPLTIFIPHTCKRERLWNEKHKIILQNTNISICFYNFTTISGPSWFMEYCLNKGFGLPSPRNILVPSIYISIRMNFKNIYLVGADHSWFKQLWVNENNEVMLDDKHFYDGSPGVKEAVHKTASLSIVLHSIGVALDSYQVLETYAQSKNINIINITPGSYIDIFKREKI